MNDKALVSGHLAYFLLGKKLTKTEWQQMQLCLCSVMAHTLLMSNCFSQEQTASHPVTYFYMCFPNVRLNTKSVCSV